MGAAKMEVIEKIVNVFCIIIFGKIYLDGFSKEPTEKDKYELSPLFPNEKAMQIVGKYFEESK